MLQQKTAWKHMGVAAGPQRCAALSGACAAETGRCRAVRLEGLTPTAGAALSIRDCGIGAGHDGAGHLFADGNGVL